MIEFLKQMYKLGKIDEVYLTKLVTAKKITSVDKKSIMEAG